jgi:drug/metabolite transporter superfamily protein YnfA
MHAMKAYGGVNLELQLLLTLVVDASELSTSHIGGFVCKNKSVIIIK